MQQKAHPIFADGAPG